MTNLTISLQESVLREARKQAINDNTSLNAVIRDFLEQYAGRKQAVKDYDSLMKKLSYVDAGRKFTREEMNER
jgi:hypothetical protein